MDATKTNRPRYAIAAPVVNGRSVVF